MDYLFQTQSISRTYRHLNAVHNLDLSLGQGSICAFLGRNGAGKTTTIRMIAGLVHPSAGSSTLMGEDSVNLPSHVWEKVGYVADYQELYDDMRVDKLIRFTSKMYNNWDHAFEKELIQTMKIKTDIKVKHCSKGERVKVCLLLAMAFRPKLLLLDEPFNGLDPLVKNEFLSALLKITQQNEWSVFFSSHDIDEVEKIADRVVVIDKGVKQIDEEVDSIQQRFKSIEMYSIDENFDVTQLKHAMNVEKEGNALRYIHSQFSDEEHTNLRNAFPNTEIQISDMSLKDWFTAMAASFQEKEFSI